MGWWTAAAALTPVHAWDALGYTSGDLPDLVGSNALLSNGSRRAVLRGAYFGVGGINGTPFIFANTIKPASSGVLLFFSAYGLAGHDGTGVVGFYDGSNNDYLTQHTVNNGGYGPNQLVAANSGVLGLSTSMATSPDFAARFVALVLNGGKGRAYVDGAWAGSETASSVISPLGYKNIGYRSGYNHSLRDNECLIAAGYWTGSPSLADLQDLEAACRAALEAPPFAARYAADPRMLVPLHPFWNRPQMGFDTVAKDQMQPIHRSHKGRVVGTLFAKGQPDAPMVRRLRCFDEQTGALLGQTISANDGGYFFSGLDPTRRVFVVAFDDQDHYRAVIADKLLPQLEV